MTTAASPSPLEVRVERLITGLAGVVSVRAVADASGSIEEIHVLATAELHPKQIVRNIESALSAGLGVMIDRRVVSIAQIRDDAPPDVAVEFATNGATPPGAAEPASPVQPVRFVFDRFDVRTNASGQAECSVVLKNDSSEFVGSGTGPNTASGRAGSAARALFDALQRARGSDDVALEGATLVEAHGRTYAMIGARGLVGRETIPLTGVAPVSRSPEEAAILACLQATNRWTEIPS